MRVVLSLPADAESFWPDMFRAALPGVEWRVRDPAKPADPDALPADYAVAYGRCGALFDEPHRLKALFTLSAGVGHLLRMPNLPRDVLVVRLEDAGMAEQMVRYVLAAALRFLQRLDVYAKQQGAVHWEQHDARSPANVTAGVMGLGVIGCQVAQALAAQGFAVRGFSRTEKKVDGVAVFAGEGRLDAFLDGVDFLVAVLPATAATEGILEPRHAVTPGRRCARRQHRPGRGAGRRRPGRAARRRQALRRNARRVSRGTVAARPSLLAPAGDPGHAPHFRPHRARGCGGAGHG